MTAKYEYLAVDTLTGDILGNLPLSGVSWTLNLMKPGTLGGKIPISAAGDSSMKLLKQISTPGATSIYMLRNNVPRFGGICWSRDYDSDARTISLNYQTFDSYWAKRFQRQTRLFSTTGDGEQIAIAQWLLGNSASTFGGDILVDIDASVTSGVLRERQFYFYEFKRVLDELNSLANLDNGFEYKVEIYRKPDDTIGRRILFGYPLIGRGSGSTDLVFSLPGNVRSFKTTEDAGSGVNQEYALGSGTAEAQMESIATATSLIGTSSGRYPLLEGSQSYTDVTVQQTLDDHAKADLAQYQTPLTVIAINVLSDGGGDPKNIVTDINSFDPGDYANFNLTDPWFADIESSTYTGNQRITSMTTPVPDQGGIEITSLVLGAVGQ